MRSGRGPRQPMTETTSSAAPSSAAARTSSSHVPTCDSVVATRSIGASRNQASTPFSAHHAPIPRTASSDARQTASVACVPRLGAKRGRVAPQRLAEPAVSAARAMAAHGRLEQQDVQLGLELEEVPGRPHAEVTAADDDDVGRRVALEGTRRASPRRHPRATSPGVCGASGSRSCAPCKSDAACDHGGDGDGHDSVQKSGRPPRTAPSETSNAERPLGGSASWPTSISAAPTRRNESQSTRSRVVPKSATISAAERSDHVEHAQREDEELRRRRQSVPAHRRGSLDATFAAAKRTPQGSSRSGIRAADQARTRGGGRDSNPRPPGPQPGALPTELPPPRRSKDSAGSVAR